MATLNCTPIRELSDSELRKRLLALGYDVPVSVNREFLVRKLENVSAGGVTGGRTKKRHSMATSPSSTPAATSSPNTVRKRKSLAAPSAANNINTASGHSHHNNSSLSTPLSSHNMSSPLSSVGGTPQQYISSPGSSMATPTTPSPYVSRLSTASPSSPSVMNNGETASHSSRYMNYYNMFKATSTGTSGNGNGGSGDVGGVSYGLPFNRGIRMTPPSNNFNPVTSVAPPSRSSERNGYIAGGGSSTASLGVESDWCGGHLVSKILVISFICFFMIIGGLYISKNMTVDPRGVTSAFGNEGGNVRKPQPRPTSSPSKKPIDLPPPPTSMTFPVCGLKGVDPEACIPKDIVKNSRTLFNTLKDELTQRGRKKGCYNDVQQVVSLHNAKKILYDLTDLRKPDVDAAFEGMLLLVTENPRGGLTLHDRDDKEIYSRGVASLDHTATKLSATGVNPDVICGITSLLTSVTLYFTIAVVSASAVYLLWKGYKFYRVRKQSEEEAVFKMVEKVLELLYQHYELSEASQGPTFLAVNHVRDELIPLKERLKKEAFWNRVVDYISNHESRVREEIQHISGEEFKVWRWLPSASPLASKRFSTNSHHQSRSRFSLPASPLMSSSPAIISPSAAAAVAGPSHTTMPPPPSPQQNSLYPNLGIMTSGGDDDDDINGGSGDANFNKWQGQAFETCEGSPNALPSTPTTCLKIRHMFTEKDGAKERSRIERNILEKCCQAHILYIGIDPSSVEGCVYVRCLTKEDARKAFLALHGWWFDGHLLSVKFLREERYFSRFPEAKNCTVPMNLPR